MKLAVELNIRAGAGFTPRSVGRGTIKGWYRGDLGISLNSGAVSAWADQSGNSATLSQGSASLQPLYVLNGLNGQPTLRFDGVNDLLVAAGVTPAQPIHIFLVMKMVTLQTTASGHTVVFSGSNAGTATLYVDSTPQSRINYASFITYAGAIANGVFARVECLANGATSSIVENDTTRVSGNAGANPMAYLSLGDLGVGTQASNVEIAEVVVYNTVLTAGELARLRNYFKGRYGIS